MSFFDSKINLSLPMMLIRLLCFLCIASITLTATNAKNAGIANQQDVKSVSNHPSGKVTSAEPIHRIAFGSCNNARKGGEIWSLIRQQNPHRLLLLGDTIYTDSRGKYLMSYNPGTPEIIKEQYDVVKKNPYFLDLLESIHGWDNVNSVFDDHDYGLNNGDKTFIYRSETMNLFWDFLDTPADSPKRKQEGVFTSSFVRLSPDLSYKVVLIDSRTNKDPKNTPNGDFLGEHQWKWLEDELLSGEIPDIVFLGSSIQLLPDDKLIEEAWREFPEQRARLLELIAKVSVRSNVVFLSGDVHSAEVLQAKLTYKNGDNTDSFHLWEFTSSGLTHTFTHSTIPPAVNVTVEDMVPIKEVPQTVRSSIAMFLFNIYQALAPHSYRLNRHGDVYKGLHFSLLDIVENTDRNYYDLVFKIIDNKGESVVTKVIELKPKSERSSASNSDDVRLVSCTPLEGPVTKTRYYLFLGLCAASALLFLVTPFVTILWFLIVSVLYFFYQKEMKRRDNLMSLHKKNT